MKLHWNRCLAVAASALTLATAWAQGFPDKPVRLVVPYATGGPSDIVARLLAPEMGSTLGQQVLVDNKPGAGSALGTELVARAPADGYTLLLTDLPVTIVPSVYRATAKFDPTRDFEYVGLIGGSNIGLVIGEAVPAKTLDEFLAYARAKPAGMSLGSGGQGSLTHLLAELFAQLGAFKYTHVPYQGSGPAMQDVIAGRLDGMFNGYFASAPYLPNGKLRMLAMASRDRAPELPNVMTFAQGGYPQLSVEYWLGIMAPAGTPKAVVDSVRAAMVKALASASVTERFNALAISRATDSGGETMRKVVAEDFKRWGDLVRQRNIAAN